MKFIPIFEIYTISITLKFYKLYHESLYFGMLNAQTLSIY